MHPCLIVNTAFQLDEHLHASLCVKSYGLVERVVPPSQGFPPHALGRGRPTSGIACLCEMAVTKMPTWMLRGPQGPPPCRHLVLYGGRRLICAPGMVASKPTLASFRRRIATGRGRASLVAQDDGVSVRLPTGHHGPFHGGRVGDVDVLIDHGHGFHRGMASAASIALAGSSSCSRRSSPRWPATTPAVDMWTSRQVTT